MKLSGCLDYCNQEGEVQQDIAPLFYVQSIIRSVETPNGLDQLEIYVNDHHNRTYTFQLSAKSIHTPNLTAELCEHGIMVDPFWSGFIASYLLNGYRACAKTNSIVYQNKVLGWYEFEDKTYYFYDETDFDGKHAICARPKMQFRKGDREKYMDLIRNVVLPSTELSLALSIGYTAVVAARLKEPADLRCNLGERLRRVHCG